MTALKPFLKKVTDVEETEILSQAMAALDQGNEDEYDRFCKMLPISPESASDLKKSIGLEALIESGINLYQAVEAYGEDWLRN
jgi:hypothetical protein